MLAWLKTRKVERKALRPKQDPRPDDPDALLKVVNARFMARVGRAMTDQEWSDAEFSIDTGRSYAKQFGGDYKDSPDDVAAKVAGKICMSATPFAHPRSSHVTSAEIADSRVQWFFARMPGRPRSSLRG